MRPHMEPRPIIPTTMSAAIRKIASKLKLDNDTVENVLNEYTNCMITALEYEMPFYINGFGKFYFSYESVKKTDKVSNYHDSKFYKNKVYKLLKFIPTVSIRNRFNEWVIDLKIKSNLAKDLIRISLKPDEIINIRRAQILKEQRELGFRPQLLFDEESLPEVDKMIMEETERIPTINEILTRLGVKLKE